MTKPVAFVGPPTDEHPLKKWRLDMRLSLRALARALEVSAPTVNAWERGTSMPRKDMVQRIRHLTSGAVGPEAWYHQEDEAA